MFNPTIVVAVIIQSLIARANRITGAIFGYIITTGILLWGLSIFSQGGWITFFGIQLSQPVFVLLCSIWFLFNTKDLILGLKLRNAPPPKPVALSAANTGQRMEPSQPAPFLPENIATNLNKICVICENEFAPPVTSHCTPNSIIATFYVEKYGVLPCYYALDGTPLAAGEIDRIRKREMKIYQAGRQAHPLR